MQILRDCGWAVDEALERTNPKDRTAHYTYVVGSHTGRVKIGHSGTPKRRLSTLQNGSPAELWLDKTWRLTRTRAKLLERQLHTAFSWAYAHGEWFDVSPIAVAAVGDLFASERLGDALQLAAVIQAIGEQDKRIEALDRAWYFSVGRTRVERSAAERAAKAALPGAKRELAAMWLEAFALGYTGQRHEREVERRRREAAYRALVAEAA